MGGDVEKGETIIRITVLKNLFSTKGHKRKT